MNYYEILGVDKKASQDEIKKAFRKKAHEHHPDKGNGNEAKFKEANEAYQTLKDEKKRAQYDQFGSAGGFNPGQSGFGGQAGGFNWQDFAQQAGGQQGGVNFEGFDLGDIFGDFFGGSARGGQGRGRRNTRGADLEYRMEIDLKESAFGAEKMIRVEKMDTCKKCDGKGYESSAKLETCAQCKGAGRVTVEQRTMFGTVRQQAMCPACEGQGKKPDKFCGSCHGAGRIKATKELKIKIPAGINNGESVKLTGEGEAGEKGSPSGDLYITFGVRPSNKFKRSGYDILSRSEINVAQASLGDKIDVETLEGDVKLKIPAGTQSGKIFKLTGKGTEKLHGRGRGDHLVEVIVKVPERLSRKAKKLLEDLQNELG